MNEEIPLTSNKPYLLRAIHEWVLDNALTPLVLIDTTHAEVDIPLSCREKEHTIFNISPNATHQLYINNDIVSFRGRFAGVEHAVSFPVTAVLAIYARENGQGIVFSQEEAAKIADTAQSSPASEQTIAKKRPHLSLVK